MRSPLRSRRPSPTRNEATSVSDLLIFDCDGVLVDSEPVANRVLHEQLRGLGLDIDLEESTRTFTGLSMASCVALVERMLGGRIPDGFVSELRRRTTEAFDGELQPVRGIEQLLSVAPAPYCVASSSTHARIRSSLGATGLLTWFRDDAIFSAEDVARGKPAPDLFLHAAARLGHLPASCTVIEDSVPGVTAARAAGMRVYGYAERTPPRLLEAAGATVVTCMMELARILAGRPGTGTTI
jgi:HAD superfamily hydrolase (TIGR01509 family)